MFMVLFATCGWEVTIAESADEAIRVFDPDGTDAILSDISLPRMDGHALLDELRGRSTSHVIAISLSGYDRPSVPPRPRNAGFDACLMKPLLLETLLDTLESLKHLAHRTD